MDTPNITRRRLLGLGAGSLAAGALLASCAAPALAQQQPPADQSQAGAAAGQPVTLYVFRSEQGIKGPDGKNHDSFVPASFVVKAGTPVQLTVINYDDGAHTMTQPDLGLNITVNPGNPQGNDVLPVTTTATFTAPNVGVYRWSCSLPCDDAAGGWDMTNGFGGQSQDGYMAGNIVAI